MNRNDLMAEFERFINSIDAPDEDLHYHVTIRADHSNEITSRSFETRAVHYKNTLDKSVSKEEPVSNPLSDYAETVYHSGRKNAPSTIYS